MMKRDVRGSRTWSKMAGVSLPVTRPVGRALLVGSASCRSQPMATLQGLGYSCAEAEDPYSAMAELCRRPLSYRALILSISSLYREELQLIRAVRRRFPHIEVWLADTDGRQSAMADGMRLGADGLLAEDGMHRMAVAPAELDRSAECLPESNGDDAHRDQETETTPASGADAPTLRRYPDESLGEPVLSADELRALLQEQPATPPNNKENGNPS